MSNEDILKPLFILFYEKLKENNFVADKTGSSCIEEICYNIFGLDPYQPILNFIVKKTNVDYCKKELNWYLSQSLSIKNYVDDVKIWTKVCTKDDKKEVNSNYGWCIFSDKNYNQYENCKNELINNMYSRRAIMIYTRPSIQQEYKRDGMSDFICTNHVQCFIRKNKSDDLILYYLVSQRSCDLIYGFMNDFVWHCYVYDKLYKDLLKIYPTLKIGNISFSFGSIHLYEYHYSLLKDIYEKYVKNL